MLSLRLSLLLIAFAVPFMGNPPRASAHATAVAQLADPRGRLEACTRFAYGDVQIVQQQDPSLLKFLNEKLGTRISTGNTLCGPACLAHILSEFSGQEPEDVLASILNPFAETNESRARMQSRGFTFGTLNKMVGEFDPNLRGEVRGDISGPPELQHLSADFWKNLIDQRKRAILVISHGGFDLGEGETRPSDEAERHAFAREFRMPTTVGGSHAVLMTAGRQLSVDRFELRLSDPRAINPFSVEGVVEYSETEHQDVLRLVDPLYRPRRMDDGRWSGHAHVVGAAFTVKRLD